MSSEKPVILIVDDEKLNRKLLGAHLSGNGYTVWEAENGSEALGKAAELPDLILLDVMMPKMNGFDVCAHLKKSEATRRIPVIYLSALKDSESKVRGLELGGVDFVSKPYNGPELLSRVKAHLTIRRQEEELSRYAATLEQMVEERTQQLIHADRLATLGTFAAAIAHEINGPLTYISISTELLAVFWEKIKTLPQKGWNEEKTGMATNEIDEFDTYVGRIDEGYKRISQLVEALRTYSGKNVEGFETAFLADPVNDAVRLLQYKFKYGVSIENAIPADLRISCNRRKLSQVFINLFSNAIDAMANQTGSLMVEAVSSGDCVTIKVRDNGPGIPDAVAQKIFDPFFTTKGEAHGTGLGLFIVKKIIEEHGGKISLAPFNGAGAQFDIELPLDG